MNPFAIMATSKFDRSIRKEIQVPLTIDALIPAWNEAELLGRTLDSLTAQTVPFRQIVVIPNGCTDNTAEIARQYETRFDNIVVLEFKEKLEHRKSEALNRAWEKYSQNADIVVTIDADTTLLPDAVELWEQEFAQFDVAESKNRPLGGSTAKAIVLYDNFWGRMQKQEYAKVVDSSLLRGSTSVLAGAGTAFAGFGLRQVAAIGDGRVGPWSYATMTEDYEITILLRKLGWETATSPYVRMYTDGMKNLRSLWAQRSKWGIGQYHELMNHGLTRYTARDWGAISMTACLISVQLLWAWIIANQLIAGSFRIHWFWWVVYPGAFVLFQLFLCGRMAHVDRRDRWYAATILPYLFYGTIGIAWVIWAWVIVARERLTGRYADRWELQQRAEHQRWSDKSFIST